MKQKQEKKLKDQIVLMYKISLMASEKTKKSCFVLTRDKYNHERRTQD